MILLYKSNNLNIRPHKPLIPQIFMITTLGLYDVKSQVEMTH